jgi:hypothetical protein
MIKIPTFQESSSDFTQEIELGGQLVQLRIVWNSRAECYFLEFTDENGDILQGIKMVPNWPLLDWHRGSIVFNGDLILIQTDAEAGNTVTYDNLGNGWGLMYMTIAELILWKEANGF